MQSPSSGISSHTTARKFSAFRRALDFFVVFKRIYMWIQSWATWIHLESSYHFSCKSHLILSSPLCLWLTSSFFLVRFFSQTFWRIVDLPQTCYCKCFHIWSPSVSLLKLYYVTSTSSQLCSYVQSSVYPSILRVNIIRQECPFYRVPEHGSYHRMSWWMQAFCTTNYHGRGHDKRDICVVILTLTVQADTGSFATK